MTRSPRTRSEPSGALRPRRLAEFVGQRVVREQLSLVSRRPAGAAPRPTTYCCPARPASQDHAGDDRGARTGRAPAGDQRTGYQHAGDLAAVAVLAGGGGGALPRRDPPDGAPGRKRCSTSPMEDFRVDIVVARDPGHGDSADASAVHHRRRHHPGGMLPGRSGTASVTGHLDFYDADDSSRCCTVRPAARRPAHRRRRPRDRPAGPGTPRIANRLLRRVRDWAQVRGTVFSTSPRHGRPCRLRGRRARPRPAGPGGSGGAVHPVRGRPGGVVDAGRRVGEEAETVETVAEAVPGPRGPARAHAPRAGWATSATWRHLGCVRLALPARCSRTCWRTSWRSRLQDGVSAGRALWSVEPVRLDSIDTSERDTVAGRSTKGLSGGPICVGLGAEGSERGEARRAPVRHPVGAGHPHDDAGSPPPQGTDDGPEPPDPGSVVMTGAGMFGTIVSVEDDQVTLETAPGQTSKWLRQAVVR